MTIKADVVAAVGLNLKFGSIQRALMAGNPDVDHVKVERASDLEHVIVVRTKAHGTHYFRVKVSEVQ